MPEVPVTYDETPAGGGDPDYDALLAYVLEQRGFDLRGYERTGVRQRIDERVAAVGAGTYRRYLDVLAGDPGEFARLFNAVLVAVSSLRRDPDAWDYLEHEVLPRLVAEKPATDPIRVWSAGCASGEEAYSLAVLLAEAVGEERFRRQVTVYATDADPEAIARARPARYRHDDLVAAFGQERTARFFEPLGEESMFRQDLRRNLVFGRHDLVEDPPITHIDLMACRNTLVYLPAAVQEKVLAALHDALVPGGFLFLGAYEAMAQHTTLFEVVDEQRHIFRRSLSPALVDDEPYLRAAFDADPLPKVVVDGDGVVVVANHRARQLLGPAAARGARLGDGVAPGADGPAAVAGAGGLTLVATVFPLGADRSGAVVTLEAPPDH